MALLPALSLALAFVQAPDLDRYVYPLATPRPSPTIVIDTEDFPQSRAWAERAKRLVETWFPAVVAMLGTEDYRPPREIKLTFKKEINVPAYASGGEITINGKWITEHPDDLGMVIHELVHVIQQYPRNKVNTGWLVEGIADYIRWWRYEPELHAGPGRTKVDPEKAKYTDAYRTTAVWLAWAGRKYHMGLVPALDRKLRKGEDPMPVFTELTGKSADELWKEFTSTLK